MNSASALTTMLAMGTAALVVGLVGYRLLWSAPQAAKLGILPQRWRRWIFGDRRKRGSTDV
jgi:hypothetical protein